MKDTERKHVLNTVFGIAGHIMLCVFLIFIMAADVKAEDIYTSESEFQTYGLHAVFFTVEKDGFYKLNFPNGWPESFGYSDARPLVNSVKSGYVESMNKASYKDYEYLLKAGYEYRFDWDGEVDKKWTATLTFSSEFRYDALDISTSKSASVSPYKLYKIHFEKPGFYNFVYNSDPDLIFGARTLLDNDLCSVYTVTAEISQNNSVNWYSVTDNSSDYYFYTAENEADALLLRKYDNGEAVELSSGGNKINTALKMYAYTAKTDEAILIKRRDNMDISVDGGYYPPLYCDCLYNYYPNKVSMKWCRALDEAYESVPLTKGESVVFYTERKNPDFEVFILNNADTPGDLTVSANQIIKQKNPSEGGLYYYNLTAAGEEGLHKVTVDHTDGSTVYVMQNFKNSAVEKLQGRPHWGSYAYYNRDNKTEFELWIGGDYAYYLMVVPDADTEYSGTVTVQKVQNDPGNNEGGQSQGDGDKNKENNNNSAITDGGKKNNQTAGANNGVDPATNLPSSDDKNNKVPGKVTIKSLKNNAKKKAKITWKKVKDADGYQIQYAQNKKFAKNTKTKKTAKTSLTIKSLKKGKKYYFRLRTYVKGKDGKLVYGKWSKVKTVVIKK
ncbi:MAG: fibronectin type III domain-containing protein [Lachnospiraceae bacterium]|nr:fibronectin type III domain-containing protein [Lachnospiraceae bacterium]